jgi:predicted lipid-binding transport protein (Tim44 family)
MNDGFHALDIIFFAMVAVFLVLRLRSVLGRRTGSERPPPQDWGMRREAPNPDAGAPDNVVDLANARRPVAEPLPEGPLGVGVAALRAADPSFSLDGFLSGARMAFEMIVEAYAAGNKKALRPLLGDEVYEPFARAIDARAAAGETLDTELMGVRKVEPIEVRMDGTVASVTVRFVSEQINLVKDAEGRILEGDPSQTTDVTDEWTFRRDTRAKDPNWQLVATRSPEDEA